MTCSSWGIAPISILGKKVFKMYFVLPFAQSSLSIFTQKYIPKCKDTYFILQNKYFCIYEDSFGAMIVRDDCALRGDGI